ncbi:UNVERIFIED_ORG: hypothetical protein BDU10_1227 [Burkholderia sp. CF145]
MHTNSALLANTGAVIGNVVQVNANDVQNTGAAAVIAAAQDLKIYAANSVSNRDGALIYSAGNLEIARDGVRDGSGFLANQTNVLTNSSADIEADGTLDIAAHTVNNVRTTLVTQMGTPQTTTTTLSTWTAGIPLGRLGSHHSITFPEWNWTLDEANYKAEIVGKLATPITVEVPKSQVTNLNAGAQTFSLTQPLTETYTDSNSTRVVTDRCNELFVCQVEVHVVEGTVHVPELEPSDIIVLIWKHVERFDAHQAETTFARKKFGLANAVQTGERQNMELQIRDRAW